MAYEEREPIVPAETMNTRPVPWYRTSGGLVGLSFIAVVLFGLSLYLAMEVGANQSCADVGGQRVARVCQLPSERVVVEDPTVVPGPVVTAPPTYVAPSPALTEEQLCAQEGGTWDGAICLT